ncbi:diaminopimelate epimerase [Sphingobium algorifonticola]|uniref:Diaminopimelate epimerase n=1 Tax=Sphingobium algorifonticola TaxID=2008318 RepID=A0A437JBC9_9SPHN|nr:diaminopimelate epimerase [Sphingobium algorifonticola]RVT43083.1 diaminopimelate epimerase [Sphingobium algorifonticola]
MNGRFSKMQGLGNDFVVIDARDAPLAMTTARARAIADRHSGIGCDQLILIEPSDVADVRMRIFNADGGEVEACGNATRCVPLFLGRDVRIETAGGLLEARLTDGGATVDMGQPRFDWDAIPLAYAMDTRDMPVGWDHLDHPAAVNVGNPHVVFFQPGMTMDDAARIGPVIETDPLFPARVNVNFAEVERADRIRLIVWERGVGLTRACGTGACATAVAAIRRGLARGPVTIVLPGGDLVIDWSPGASIRMSGPAAHVFDGTADWTRF